MGLRPEWIRRTKTSYLKVLLHRLHAVSDVVRFKCVQMPFGCCQCLAHSIQQVDGCERLRRSEVTFVAKKCEPSIQKTASAIRKTKTEPLSFGEVRARDRQSVAKLSARKDVCPFGKSILCCAVRSPHPRTVVTVSSHEASVPRHREFIDIG